MTTSQMEGWARQNMENDSMINKVQHQYWITKQTVFRKLGKKEDECIISSDAELDAKLELFKSIQDTSRILLKIISQYQNQSNTLALEENDMGRFMKESSKYDKTRAGKMMDAVGTSICYVGQQRFTVQPSLERLHHKLETFLRRAIADTSQAVNWMEKARTEYRAALNWMKDISQELDPDTYRQIERFKKVQEHVKQSKSEFDRLKNVCVTKIDVLAASRSNMFSNLLMSYEKSLLEFTEKCANTFTVIANSFKGYQHYDFCVVKELSDLKPDSSILAHEEIEDKLLEFEECIDSTDKMQSVTNGGQSNGSTIPKSGDSELLCDLLDTSSTKPQGQFYLPSQLLSMSSSEQMLCDMGRGVTEPVSSKKSELNSTVKKSNWFDLFAELDPLSNPDIINKSSDQQSC